MYASLCNVFFGYKHFQFLSNVYHYIFLIIFILYYIILVTWMTTTWFGCSWYSRNDYNLVDCLLVIPAVFWLNDGERKG